MLGTTDDDLAFGFLPSRHVTAGAELDMRAFRDALGCFPTGIAIVTARDIDGGPVGVTVNSFTSLSLDPPLVLWNLANRSSTFDAFAAASHFAVHVLAEGQEGLCRQFARSGADRFENIALDEGEGGVPIIAGSAALFECRRLHRHRGGDHAVFVGRVERFRRWEERTPLVFHQGRIKVLAA